MSFADHMEAIKKEMSTMTSQLGQNKSDLERTRSEMSQVQLQVQQLTNQEGLQAELQKANDMSKKLEAIARTFLATLGDQGQQSQLLGELEAISKNSAPQMPVMTPPIAAMNAVAAMQPHMMMRNPMLSAMSGASPRVGKGAPPNGGMNGMAMMQQMQLAQMQAAQQAMMHAQMFPGMFPGVPGMLPGMPPGMAALPGMMPPNSAAAAAAAMQQFNAAQAQMAAAAIAVSTPSRNHSSSGAASRTRTPLTASATNSPRPTTEPVIKEEDPPSMEADVSVAATTATSIKQEENSTVAVA